MTYDLFPHQERGASFLAEDSGTAGLFFGMGTGKTITSLEGFKRSDANRLLVIAPPIALPMWHREIEAYLNTPALILKTGKTPLGEFDAVVVSYAIAMNRKDELRDWLGSDCSVLICDESHALKSTKAKRTQAILGHGGIADGAFYNWQLTGTPITRWNDDMFPFLCRADLPGLIDRCGSTSMEKFLLRYTIRKEKQFPGARWPVKMVVGNARTEELANWVYGEELALRVDLEEVFANMPPLTQNRYEIKLDADAELKRKLKEMEDMTVDQLQEQAKRKEPALATVRRELGLAKVKYAAEEIMERIDSGQNVLVGAWHTEVIDALSRELSRRLGAEMSGNKRNAANGLVQVIDGRTNPNLKDTLSGLWNEGGIKALICQIAAAGVSLNLQHGGTQIVVVEEDWSPAIMDQFYARLWRYGQEKHVHVDTLMSGTKLDQALARIAGTKASQQEKFNAIGREMNDA